MPPPSRSSPSSPVRPMAAPGTAAASSSGTTRSMNATERDGTRRNAIDPRRSPRQEPAEPRPAMPGVLDVDPPVVLLDDARYHREPQPRAALALLGRVERIEDPVLDLGGDADPAVGDRDRDEVLL